MWAVHDHIDANMDDNVNGSQEKRDIQRDIRRYKHLRGTHGVHPKTYTQLTRKDVEEMRTSASFFWRKFSKECNLSQHCRMFLNSRLSHTF